MNNTIMSIPENILLQKLVGELPSVRIEIDFRTKEDVSEDLLLGNQVGDSLWLNEIPGKKKLLISLGKKAKLNSDSFRQAGGISAKTLRSSRITSVYLDLSYISNLGIQDSTQAALEGLCLGAYQFNQFKSGEKFTDVTTIFLHSDTDQELERVIEKVQLTTKAVILAREWAHQPANILNPITLAEKVSALALDYGLKCRILDDNELEAMHAGGIVGVGKGSATPSRLIILEYGGSEPTGKNPIVLVGKALTFDTGGYSLKTVEGIQGMKYDKCGGITVAAILMAASILKLQTPIIGIIAAAENMVSDHSYRPDDILTMLSGKTVEIISADAEGRLVLADALTYAQQQFKPRFIIDLATLTGGVVTALGRVRAGLMANNDDLAVQLFAAGEKTAERLWRLPLDDDYAKLIKSDEADIKNSGGREGHAILGGMFLKEFVDDSVPWAHLDIAGVADTPKELSYCPKGATGFGVRLMIEFLERNG